MPKRKPVLGYEPTSIRAWLDNAGDGMPDFDHPAYRRMAEVLIGGMQAVGGDKPNEGLNLAIKVLAMISLGAFQRHPEHELIELCDTIGRVLTEEVLSLRVALYQDLDARQ